MKALKNVFLNLLRMRQENCISVAFVIDQQEVFPSLIVASSYLSLSLLKWALFFF